MELCVNDRITVQPFPDDIGRAIEAAPHPQGWYLILESNDALIEAGAEADGRYIVSASDRGREFEAGMPLDAGQLKAILFRFCGGGSASGIFGTCNGATTPARRLTSFRVTPVPARPAWCSPQSSV